MSEWNAFRVRVHGNAVLPTLIYLPGLHGDWTLVSSFRAAVEKRVRFVAFTYPRTLTASLDEHAAAILDKLAEHGIQKGWILAESFGSVLAWKVLEQATDFEAQGVILAGGFVRYPYAVLVRVARAINRAMPLWLIQWLCRVYGRYALLRHRSAPETLECVSEFIRRRSEAADREAICYRYDLILQSDAREFARKATVPVHQLCGFVDPIVPWFSVRRWLKRHCASYKGWRLIWRADHNVLGTAPRAAAEQIVSWMSLSIPRATN
jgi:pimeloyl-ACP methyl ester carboxylesterase